MSCQLGENRDLFFPKLDHDLNLVTFSSIAEKYLMNLGYEPVQCATEDEARARVGELKAQHKYPVYFFKSDTTGEKDFEEFYTENEKIVINHIHGYADDSESIIVGHATHPEYPFVELLEQKFIKPKSQRLKGLYYVESALYETDKHIQDNVDDMCEFMVLDGVDIEQIENIYVLGHSFGEQDFEYFDFLEKVTKVGCNYNELSALWKVHHIGLEELTEESILEDIRLNLLYAQHHRERELLKKDDLFLEYTLIEKILGIDKENVYTEEIANKAAEAVKRRFIFEQALRTKHVLEEICILKHIEEIPESAECASVFKLADYIDGIHEKRKINAKWHISYFNEEDKIRIANVMHRIDCTDYELIHGIDECIKKNAEVI